MDGWSVTQRLFTKANCSKKSLHRKSKLVLSTLVTTWLSNIAFHLQSIWLQNFGCYRIRVMPDIVSKLLRAAIWSRCTVRFESEHFLGHSSSSIWIWCFAQDSIWNMRFCSYVTFLLRDQWMIKRLSKETGAALVGNNISPIPLKISFRMKKKLLVAARNLKSIETFLTLELSQYRKSSCKLSQSRPAATAAD